LEYETAGDPVTGLKWTKKTTEKIADELRLNGINVCANTVRKLLKKMNYSLRVNHKKKSSTVTVTVDERDQQFTYIKDQRKLFSQDSSATISVDTKKRETIGNFKNAGRSWCDKPILVKDHDFRSESDGIAIPYGIYEVLMNIGNIFIGKTYDTPAFAVDSIELWWRLWGKQRYLTSNWLLILADQGGSNSSRSRVWKYLIQQKLCNLHNLSVTVCHYPPGASKWNLIEHRLFSEISKNWAGRPLDSYETMGKYIKTTTTKTGLKVNCHVVDKHYEKGEKITDEQMASLCLKKHVVFPMWNYTLFPQFN
jgi:hypothetical protein